MKKKIIFFHVLFWLLTLVDYTFISNWFAQQGSTEPVNNSLGLSYTAFQLVKRLPLLLLHVLFCYANLLLLVPYFFRRKRYLTYTAVLLVITVLLYLPIRYGIEHHFYRWLGGTGLMYTDKLFWMSDSSLYVFRLYFYGIAYYLTWQWFRSEKEKEELKSQNLTTELSFLKSQINPHFLLNTLSNLYSLAYKRSEKTADAIMKLSEMMRYMLHESNKPQVSVSEEIRYLYNYIELQKLRTHKACCISLSINEAHEGQTIAPLLLIPFVENVFKHGDIHDPEHPVVIQLEIGPAGLCFKVKNKIRQQQKDETSGIGLQNIERRLQLIYPGQHQLEIHKSEAFHEVHLNLDLI